MAKHYKGMTHKEHLEIADELAIVVHHMIKIVRKCENHYAKSTKLMRILYRISPGYIDGSFSKLRSELENTWYKDTTRKERNGHGFIHYNLDERYPK